MEAIGGTGLKVCSSLYADRHLRRRSFLTWGAPSLFSLARETLLVPPLSPKLLLTCAGGQVRPYGQDVTFPHLFGRTSPPLRSIPITSLKARLLYETTMFTRRPFTTMTLRTVLPSVARDTASSAVALIASSSASTATEILAFTLPFSCTASSTSSAFA